LSRRPAQARKGAGLPWEVKKLKNRGNLISQGKYRFSTPNKGVPP
jgi:hypothetical protein